MGARHRPTWWLLLRYRCGDPSDEGARLRPSRFMCRYLGFLVLRCLLVAVVLWPGGLRNEPPYDVVLALLPRLAWAGLFTVTGVLAAGAIITCSFWRAKVSIALAAALTAAWSVGISLSALTHGLHGATEAAFGIALLGKDLAMAGHPWTAYEDRFLSRGAPGTWLPGDGLPGIHQPGSPEAPGSARPM